MDNGVVVFLVYVATVVVLLLAVAHVIKNDEEPF